MNTPAEKTHIGLCASSTLVSGQESAEDAETGSPCVWTLNLPWELSRRDISADLEATQNLQ